MSGPVRDWRTIANNLGKASAAKDLELETLRARLAERDEADRRRNGTFCYCGIPNEPCDGWRAGLCSTASKAPRGSEDWARAVEQQLAEVQGSESRLLASALELARALDPNEATRPGVTNACAVAIERLAEAEETLKLWRDGEGSHDSHHAPMCPANRYHRDPTGKRCTCGAPTYRDQETFIEGVASRLHMHHRCTLDSYIKGLEQVVASWDEAKKQLAEREAEVESWRAAARTSDLRIDELTAEVENHERVLRDIAKAAGSPSVLACQIVGIVEGLTAEVARLREERDREREQANEWLVQKHDLEQARERDAEEMKRCEAMMARLARRECRCADAPETCDRCVAECRRDALRARLAREDGGRDGE